MIFKNLALRGITIITLAGTLAACGNNPGPGTPGCEESDSCQKIVTIKVVPETKPTREGHRLDLNQAATVRIYRVEKEYFFNPEVEAFIELQPNADGNYVGDFAYSAERFENHAVAVVAFLDQNGSGHLDGGDQYSYRYFQLEGQNSISLETHFQLEQTYPIEGSITAKYGTNSDGIEDFYYRFECQRTDLFARDLIQFGMVDDGYSPWRQSTGRLNQAQAIDEWEFRYTSQYNQCDLIAWIDLDQDGTYSDVDLQKIIGLNIDPMHESLVNIEIDFDTEDGNLAVITDSNETSPQRTSSENQNRKHPIDLI